MFQIHSYLHRLNRPSFRNTCLPLAAAAALLFIVSAGASAQSQKNTKTDKKNAADSASTAPLALLPDPQAIDDSISQMLAAWQVGDVDGMHKYYADDVAVISGAFEPPLMGWDNYARAYQAQRARTEFARLERTNSYVKVSGDMAWATYQWEFMGQVDGKSMEAFGHTTLVLEKRASRWVIVLNHTSAADAAPQTAAVPATANSATP